MDRKNIIAFLMVVFLAFSVLNAGTTTGNQPITETVSMNTSFTFSTSCFIGFSKAEVTDCGQIPEHLKYKTGDVILCKFDPNENAYISDVFYAYCQAFSKKNLTVTVKAPTQLTEVNGTNKISYSMVMSSGSWKDRNGIRSLKKSENNAGGKVRVALSQPIQIRVESKDVEYGKSYSMNMTLEVKTNA